jgi:hypothetical protein
MSTSGIGPFGFLALGLIWLVGAANLQMHLTKTGVLYGSYVSKDGWSRVCRYYLPVQVLEVSQPIMKPCDARSKFTDGGRPKVSAVSR